MNTQEARDAIIDYLRKELVGPAPGFPATQLDGEEILRPQDPPRLRYSAGILFPTKIPLPSQMDANEDVMEQAEAAPVEDSGRPDTAAEDNLVGGRSDIRAEQQSDTDWDVNLANQFLPCAMGLSALVDVPEKLTVRVSAARYRKHDLPGLVRGTRSTTQEAAKVWMRSPFVTEIEFARNELLGSRTVSMERAVCVDGATTGLSVHVVSRPYHFAARQNQVRLVSFSLINRNMSDKSSCDDLCFFQCRLEVSCTGAGCFLEYPNRSDTSDQEERSLRFLYRNRKVFAVGHGCAGDWAEQYDGRCSRIWTEILPQYEVRPIEHEDLPEIKLFLKSLSDEHSCETIRLCSSLADAYESWIEQQRLRVPHEVPPEFRDVANSNLDECQLCLSRIRDGIDLLESDVEARQAFALANHAMYLQQAHYELASKKVRDWTVRDGSLRLTARYEAPNYGERGARWRPFQLAFLLMNLQSIARPDSEDRGIVDLIWFPTGGGKTEGYLGLSAFAIMLRRLRNPDNAGTTVLMRYTLRLLTTQQFQRAASLICACEYLRRDREADLGTSPISIGLFVGQGVTPNRHDEAIRALNELYNGARENPFVLLACPWCGAQMGPVRSGSGWMVKGYQKKSNPSRVEFCCEDPDCLFGPPLGLPVKVVDEAIYDAPPSLVIGTVDKFAMLPWRPEARSLFGLEHNYDPPDLIIQDELHLISGPLGSMVAHYETAIEALCRSREDRKPPKIIASTATIAHAAEQISALYNGRQSFLFPPQGLAAGESFFARENTSRPGRCYVGVFASALPSHVTAQIRVVSALLQSVKLLSVDDPSVIDPYWTLMAYFNSIRELGHAATLIRADIREYMNAMWDRQGLVGSVGGPEVLKKRRFINRDLELTSRIQSNQIPEILQQLFSRLDVDNEYSSVDICLATNMIQVGLDVPRLSLMTIIGQPKTTAEYIQASSRVGRQEPGLVVTIYNPARPRDRSHYEHFRSYHQSLYQFVEPTSITPFAQPVIERALHAVAVALIRALGDERIRSRPNSPPPDDDLVEHVRSTLLDRISRVDSEQKASLVARFEYIINKWRRIPPSRYGDFGPPDEEEPLMYPSGSEPHPKWSIRPLPTPSSMRNVDSACDIGLIQNYPQTD